MPLLMLTTEETNALRDILTMHCEGLEVTKERIIETEDSDRLLPLTAAVDEAVTVAERLLRRLQNVV